MKRRSAARTSTSSPRARSRASGSGGSARVLMTRCTCGGRWSSRNAIAVVDVRRRRRGGSRRGRGRRRPAATLSSLSSAGQHGRRSGAWPATRSRASAPAPTPGRPRVEGGEDVGPERRRRRCRRSSRDTHATRGRASPSAPPASAASSVVLPNPAGAETSSQPARRAAPEPLVEPRSRRPARAAAAGGRAWSRPGRAGISALRHLAGVRLAVSAARTCMRSPGRPKMLSTSAGPVAGAAEPVRHLGVELGRPHRARAPGPGRRGRAASARTARRATRSRRGCAASASTGRAG